MIHFPLNSKKRDEEGNAANQNTLRNIGLICKREYKNQVARRSFLVTSIIYLVIIIVGSFVPTLIQYIGAHSNSQTHLVVINRASSVAGLSGNALTSYIETMLNGQDEQSSGSNSTANGHFAVTMNEVAALQQTQSAVKSGKIDVLLVINRATDGKIDFAYYTTSGDLTDSDKVQVQTMAGQLSVLDQAKQQHLSSAQISNLFATPQFTVTDLQDTQSNRSVADWVTGLILAYIGIILIFIANMLYGVSVAHGVAEEKGSRIMELLILAATPFQLMFGKILGIGAAGLTQIGALILVGIAMLEIQQPIHAALLGNANGGFAINITSASITMLLLVLLYFVLAFALYSSLYAAAGALVQRQEEVQNAGTPITLLFSIGYITSISIVSIPSVPDATWFKVLSYIPFWTPTTMLVRIAIGTVNWWEIPITVGLMILTFLGCAWLSARIYRYGVLMYGQRFKLSQLAKIIRAG